jgi:hypothetical protein
MELAISSFSDITYMCELTPTPIVAISIGFIELGVRGIIP